MAVSLQSERVNGRVNHQLNNNRELTNQLLIDYIQLLIEYKENTMKRAIDFYYAAKEGHSHYEMARILGCSDQAISVWRKGGPMKPYFAARCASIAKLNPEEAMAIAAAEGEHDPEKREYLFNIINERYNSAPVGSLAQLVEQRTLNP